MKVDLNRADKTKRWKIPDKFVNNEFYNFLNNTFPLEENDVVRDKIAITGGGSVQEWADYYQLWELHGIDLDAILKLLDDKGCAKVNKKENYLQYHHQNMTYLATEIQARIA